MQNLCLHVLRSSVGECPSLTSQGSNPTRTRSGLQGRAVAVAGAGVLRGGHHPAPRERPCVHPGVLSPPRCCVAESRRKETRPGPGAYTLGAALGAGTRAL